MIFLFRICSYNLRYRPVEEPVIKHRTFDPETRGLKKHTPEDDVVMEDTVEKKVEGLAEKIIAEDAERRAQELVSHTPPLCPFQSLMFRPGFV